MSNPTDPLRLAKTFDEAVRVIGRAHPAGEMLSRAWVLEKSGYLILAGDFSPSANVDASYVVSVRRRGEAMPLLFLTFSKRPVDAVTSLYWQPGGWEIEATDLCLDALEHSVTRH